MKLSSIFAKSLFDQRRSFAGWSLGVGLLVIVMAAMWPSVRDMPGLDTFVQNYPAALRKLFNLETFRTGSGYLNTELFSLMVPALFLVFGIGHGARLLAGEEEDRTLDVLLSTRCSRRRVLLEKAAGLVVVVIGLGLVLTVVTLIMGLVLGMGMTVGEVVRGGLAMAALGIEFGLVALAVGAARGRRAVAIAVATALAIAGYVLYVLGQLIHAVEPWRGISPFVQALDRGPIRPSWSAGPAVMILCGVVALAISIPVFERRDIGS